MEYIRKHFPTIYRRRKGLLILLALVCIAQIRGRVTEGWMAKYRDRPRNAARALALEAEEALARGSFAKFHESSRKFIEEQGADNEVGVYTPDGKCLFHSFYKLDVYSPTIAEGVSGQYAKKSLTEGSEQLFEWEDSGIGRMIYTFPLKRDGKIAGVLSVSFHSDSVYRYRTYNLGLVGMRFLVSPAGR